jgi:uroporphyrin-III C-methyltransferase
VTGKVHLVGAGPGDPELLTLKGLRLLRTAQAVLHDDLVAPEILRLIPSKAQVYNVGKRCGKKQIRQEGINFLMVELARSGLQVVRLKGGDPLIFGRAGEEIEFLRRNQIPYEIVPGVTSALGAAAAAQIPLTHRHASSAVVFMTAHRASASDAADWSKFVASGATLVIYMPGQNYSDVAGKLMAAGLTRETPCAIISRATTRQERVQRSTVGHLHLAPQLAAPTLLVVGDVVRLSDPTAIAEELAMANPEAGEHTSLPVSLFNTFLSQSEAFEGDEGPIA